MKKLLTLLILILISSFAFGGEIPGQKKNITVESITSDEALPITSYYSPMKTDTVSEGAVTVDFNDGNNHRIVLPSGATTITLSNFVDGCSCEIYLKQPASGAAGTVTFSPTLDWGSGVAGVLTVTNGAIDVLTVGYNETDSIYDADLNLDVK
jgi:hypothetical protein